MKYSPKIMGILNVTPDSFYDGNPSLSNLDISKKITNLEEADIIDVGCESSRPGSNGITIREELKRLDTILPLISNIENKLFSIDTSKYEVAEHAVKHGFKIINDITKRVSVIVPTHDSNHEICRIVAFSPGKKKVVKL